MIQVRVISLPTSTDRRGKAAAQLESTGWEWAFQEAVDGRKIGIPVNRYDEKKVLRLLGYGLTRSEIGCYLSHELCWKTCLESRRPTLILEDDFVLRNANIVDLFKQDEFWSASWDAVRLQALSELSAKTVAEFGDFSMVQVMGDPVAAAAYLIKPQAAQMLLHHSNKIYEPVDHFLEHNKKHGLKMLALQPYPFTVEDPEGKNTTITDRSIRTPVKGLQKCLRSFSRLLDRCFSSEPWFPK